MLRYSLHIAIYKFIASQKQEKVTRHGELMLFHTMQVMYEEASQVANDAVGSIRTVASFCAEEKVMDIYQKKCEAPRKFGVKQGMISGFSFGLGSSANYLATAFCFWIGARLIEHGKATFGDVFKVRRDWLITQGYSCM